MSFAADQLCNDLFACILTHRWDWARTCVNDLEPMAAEEPRVRDVLAWARPVVQRAEEPTTWPRADLLGQIVTESFERLLKHADQRRLVALSEVAEPWFIEQARRDEFDRILIRRFMEHKARDLALPCFKRLIDRGVATPGELSTYATLLLSPEVLDEGLTVSERAAELAPDDPTVQGKRAIVLRRAGRLQDADQLLRRAMDLGGTEGWLFGQMAAVATLRGDAAGGVDWARRAVDEAPDTAWSHGILAYCAARAGQKDVVGEARAASLARDPDLDWLAGHLGLTPEAWLAETGGPA